MATPKQANDLTSYYLELYEAKYKHKPVVNRHSARWSWDNILQDMTVAEAKQLLEYYFAVNSIKGHDLVSFFYNYDKIIQSMKTADADREFRAKLMKESEQRAKEWNKKRGIK